MPASFLYDNKLRSVQASVTVSSESTLYPKANLYDENGAKVFRTANASSLHTVANDFGSAVAVDTVALINVNFRSTATIKVQASALSDFSVLDLDSTVVVSGLGQDPPHYNLFHKFGSLTRRYWRLSISDISNPDGFYEIGEWVIGVRIDAASKQDPELPYTETFPDANVMHETEWLHEYVYIRDVEDVRRIALEFNSVTAATRDLLRKLKRFTKTGGHPFVFTHDHTASPAETFFVRMSSELEIVRTTPTAYVVRLQLREGARGTALPTDV